MTDVEVQRLLPWRLIMLSGPYPTGYFCEIVYRCKLNYCVFSTGDLKAQLSEESVTLQAEELESISQVDESDVTLMASNSKIEVS